VTRLRGVLFEPWALGDSIIAASVARLCAGEWALACRPEWHAIIDAATVKEARFPLIAVGASYSERSRRHAFASGKRMRSSEGRRREYDSVTVLSIRGDPRDWILAKRYFPGCKLRISGWIAAAAWHSRVLDSPWRTGILSVRNRYRMWSERLGISWDSLSRSYRAAPSPQTPKETKFLIHVGARWASKQYPHIAALEARLRDCGAITTMVCGPNDHLPPNLSANIVTRVEGSRLVEFMHNADVVIANDSGPMHLAAYMGRMTFALSRTSNINYWIPPRLVTPLPSKDMPRGYSPLPDYCSDAVNTRGWMSPDEAATRIVRRLASEDSW